MDYSIMKIKDIKKAADAGDSCACIEMYERCMNEYEDETGAKEYIDKAEKHLFDIKDNADKEQVCLKLADIYVNSNPKKARKMLEYARELGSSIACFKLVEFYKNGIGGPVDLAAARICQDSSFDSISSCEKLKLASECLKEGSILEACSYYEDIRDNMDSSEDERSTANLYLIAINPKRYYKGAEQLPSIVRNMSPQNIDEVCSMLIKNDSKKVFNIILEISKIQDTNFLNYYLGTHYLAGNCTTQNVGLGIGKLEKSGTHGNAEAQFQLFKIYYEGKYDIVGTDLDRSLMWLRRAVEGGNAEAQRQLGAFYRKGEGVNKDLKEAYSLLEKAVSKNDVKAMREFGLLHLTDEYQNMQKAYTFLLHASEGGDIESYYHLGPFYEFGYYVKKSYAKAMNCYKIVSDCNNLDDEKMRVTAFFKMGQYYEEGKGRSVDYSKAYKTYKEAKILADEKGFNIPELETKVNHCLKKLYEIEQQEKRAEEETKKNNTTSANNQKNETSSSNERSSTSETRKTNANSGTNKTSKSSGKPVRNEDEKPVSSGFGFTALSAIFFTVMSNFEGFTNTLGKLFSSPRYVDSYFATLFREEHLPPYFLQLFIIVFLAVLGIAITMADSKGFGKKIRTLVINVILFVFMFLLMTIIIKIGF